MTDDSLLPFDLPSVQRKRVSAAFDGGLISSDACLVLLRPGKTPSGPEVRTLLKHLVRRIRRLLADARPARRHSPCRAARPCTVRNPEVAPPQDRRPRRRKGHPSPHSLHIGLPERRSLPPAGRPSRRSRPLSAGAKCPDHPGPSNPHSITTILKSRRQTAAQDNTRRQLKLTCKTDRVESRTGAPASGSGGGSVAFAPGLSPAPMAAFPVPAHQTGRADFPHPAFGRDHAIACRRPLVLGDRRVRPYSSRSLVSGKRTYFPDFTLCLRQSHRRSRRIAWRSTAL